MEKINNTTAKIDSKSWTRPAVFNWLQEQGNIIDSEMYRTFNCGVGMVVVVAQDDQEKAIELLQQQGETVFTLGHIEHSSKTIPSVSID